MTRLIAAVCAFAGLAAASFAPAAAAQTPSAQTFGASYAVRIYGMTAGQFDLAVKLDGAGGYEASTVQKTTGLVRSIVGEKQDYKASARGVVTANAVRPATYQHQGGRRNRLVTVTYGASDVVTTAQPAFGSMGDPPATRDQKLGSTDNVSSFVDMLLAPGASNPCARTIRVFDGRARFDLVMKPNGMQDIHTRAWKGKAYRCTVQYKPVAGFSAPEPGEDRPTDDPLTFLFAPLPGGLYAPVRIEWPTDGAGLAIMEAKSFSRS